MGINQNFPWFGPPYLEELRRDLIAKTVLAFDIRKREVGGNEKRTYFSEASESDEGSFRGTIGLQVAGTIFLEGGVPTLANKTGEEPP